MNAFHHIMILQHSRGGLTCSCFLKWPVTPYMQWLGPCKGVMCIKMYKHIKINSRYQLLSRYDKYLSTNINTNEQLIIHDIRMEDHAISYIVNKGDCTRYKGDWTSNGIWLSLKLVFVPENCISEMMVCSHTRCARTRAQHPLPHTHPVWLCCLFTRISVL